MAVGQIVAPIPAKTLWQPQAIEQSSGHYNHPQPAILYM